MYNISCVLLVEDDAIATFIALKAIKSLNFIQEIKVCHSGKAGVEFLANKSINKEPAPELIFFDIHMKEVDGYEFLKQALKLYFINKEKVIFCVLTNSSHPDDKKNFLALGIHEYLIKPLFKDDVQRIYNKYFNRGV